VQREKKWTKKRKARGGHEEEKVTSARDIGRRSRKKKVRASASRRTRRRSAEEGHSQTWIREGIVVERAVRETREAIKEMRVVAGGRAQQEVGRDHGRGPAEEKRGDRVSAETQAKRARHKAAEETDAGRCSSRWRARAERRKREAEGVEAIPARPGPAAAKSRLPPRKPRLPARGRRPRARKKRWPCRTWHGATAPRCDAILTAGQADAQVIEAPPPTPKPPDARHVRADARARKSSALPSQLRTSRCRSHAQQGGFFFSGPGETRR